MHFFFFFVVIPFMLFVIFFIYLKYTKVGKSDAFASAIMTLVWRRVKYKMQQQQNYNKKRTREKKMRPPDQNFTWTVDVELIGLNRPTGWYGDDLAWLPTTDAAIADFAFCFCNENLLSDLVLSCTRDMICRWVRALLGGKMNPKKRKTKEQEQKQNELY